MPQQQRMKSVPVEGVGEFDVPADWDDNQVKDYLDRYRKLDPGLFGRAAAPAPKPPPKSPFEAIPERPATIGPYEPGGFEKIRRSASKLLAGLPGLTPQTAAGRAIGVGEMTREGVDEARRLRNTSLLPEGVVPVTVLGLARTYLAGEKGAAPFIEAKLT